jgi:hypothetical protein
VFGSRVPNLKDAMLGEGSPPPLEFSKKRPRSARIMKRDSVKILKRDSRSIKSVRLSSTLLLPLFFITNR